MSVGNGKSRITRRRFIKWSNVAVLGVGLGFGYTSIPLLRPKKNRLRPPGALEENLFVATCIKCGQCLQVCPPQAINLAHIEDGFGIGTPYLIPRINGCILCRGLPCVLACPTGALSHELSEGKDAEMGLAVLTRPDTCLAMLGGDCRICLEECPIKEELPIVFERHVSPEGKVYHEPVVQQTCVGCGKCEMECPTEETSIAIVPRKKWDGGAA